MTTRRSFLTHGVSAFAALTAFRGRLSAGDTLRAEGYGPLSPVADETTGLELLKLPEGFTYRTFGWIGDEMSDGRPTPGVHDGMAVVADDAGVLTLVRNHEIESFGRPIGEVAQSYDAKAGGGCTTIRYDAVAGRWLDARVSLSGTSRNCAGGRTPWGTWLSCEETVFGPGVEYKGRLYGYEQDHGYVFEVPASGVSDARPIKDMGRFWHEAVAVDPGTGILYETEDRSTAGFYRFQPSTPGVDGTAPDLHAGGRLQMMKLSGRTDTRRGVTAGQSFDVSWVDIEDPDRPHSPGSDDTLGVYMQGHLQGAATFGRLEGCEYAEGHIFVTATIGGEAQKGQVWRYTPAEEKLTLLYESPAADVLDMPDNLAVSPRGGLVLCEDGYHKPQRLHALSADGRLFPLAANNVLLAGQKNSIKGDFRGDEWAGACFSPDGRTLFVNIQTPGFTVAINGPWGEGLV